MKIPFARSFRTIAQHLYLWHETVCDNQLSSIINRRVFVLAGGFTVCFVLVGVRLVDVMVCNSPIPYSNALENIQANAAMPRADIIDRNGAVLATHLVTASAYANPRSILDAPEAARLLHSVLPDTPEEKFLHRLTSGKSFVWIARHLTPRKQEAIQRLGIPGVYLKKDYRRVYPFGRLACHAIGFCNIDGQGIAGIEKHFDQELWMGNQPLRLSLDINVQHIVHEILQETVSEFRAIGGNAIVMKVKTGEIIAMESLPCVDLNHPGRAPAANLFNRNTLAVNEPGSVFKILNVAIALETRTATVRSRFDASVPVKIGRFTVSDFKGKNRSLTLSEAFVYSSNIAAVKIAQQFGGASVQQEFFKKWGLFQPAKIELPEVGRPLFPARWTEATALSSSYGYGLAVSPIGLLRVVNGIINDGCLVQPTLLYEAKTLGTRIISAETSKIVRCLMHDVVLRGTAKKARVDGYHVFGKTGTAYKTQSGGYGEGNNRPRMTFFIGGFPMHAPEYIVLVMIDEPKPTEKTFGYATGGWTAAPCGGKIIERIAPLLGVKAQPENDKPFFINDTVLSPQRTGAPARYQNMEKLVHSLLR